MKNLKNIDSRKLVSSTLFDVNVGDTFHTKTMRITGFGTTWKVIKVTPKQVHAELVDCWFPVFENTAFGRIAKGEDKDQVEWLDNHVKLFKGSVKKFWKIGKFVGDNEPRVVELIN